MKDQGDTRVCHLVFYPEVTALAPVSKCMEFFCDEDWEEGRSGRYDEVQEK